MLNEVAASRYFSLSAFVWAPGYAERLFGRSLGCSVGAGEKDLSTDGESDWLEEGGNEERKGEGN